MKPRLLSLLLVILASIMPMKLWAAEGDAEPYAVLSDNDTKLTFYYDTEKDARGGMGVGPFSHYSQRPWQTSADDITTIVIDDSFAQCDTLTNIAWWFYELKNLTQINGMANLKTDHVTDMSHLFAVSWSLSSVDVSHFNTSNVTNMEGMFASCWALTSLDVSNFNTEKVTNMAGMFNSLNGIITLDISNFNTANVTNMQGMFASNQSLTTIFVGNGWSTASVTDNGGSGVFSGSTSIIGGQGTVFDADHTDYTYARIDGGASNPGYFTDKNAAPSQNFAEYIWEVGVNNNWDGDREPLYCGDGRGTYVGFFYAQDADWSEGKGAFKFRGAPDNWDNGNYGTGTINQDGLSGTLINDNASGNILAEPAFYRAEVNLANMTYQLTSISAIGIIGTAQSGGWNIDTDMTYNKETRAWEATVDLAADEFKFRANHAWDINWGGTADSLVANGENLRIDEAGTYFIQFFPLCETKSYCIITKKSSAGTTAEPYAALSDNNTVLTFYYDDQMSARGGMSVGPFSSSYDVPWYNQMGRITTVEFDLAFANCTSITSTAFWFYECSNLTSISGIQYLKTDNVTSMGYMFYGCSGLTNLDVSGFNTANVTEMYDMFNGCSGLTSLDLSGFKTDNVTDMMYMFSGCSGLTNLDIHGFNTANVTDMRYLFSGCNALRSLDVSHFNTANVTIMNEMFSGCSSLTSLDVSHFNTANVTDMGYMFAGCTALTSIDVSNFNTENVTDMDFMFINCSSLTSLDVTNFKTANVTNMYAMFSGCSGLTSLDVSRFNTANVTDMSSMFAGCSSLTSLDLSNFKTDKVTTMFLMFEGCLGLTSLDLSSFNTENVTKFSNMFKDCSNLKTIYVGNDWNTSKAEEGAGMFLNCTSLVGGAGTIFDANHVDYTYAHIDGGASNPGYFTDKNAPEGEATFDGLVARVSGERTLDEAFEQRGGRAEAEKTIAAIVWNKETALTNSDLQGITNPNLLVYVNDASLAPSNVQNVVINGMAREIVLTDAQDGNNDWYAPQGFVAERISYTRNFGQSTTKGTSRGWESIALPFDVQTIQHETKGVIAPFYNQASNRHFWLRRLTENGLQAVSSIEANTPYIISMPNSEEYVADYNLNGQVTFSAQNVDVPATVTNTLALADSSIVMVPAMQRKERSSAVWALNVGEVRGSYFEGSVYERDYREVRPFEAYTVHRLENSQPAPRYIPIQEIGGTTGIDASLMNSEEVNSEEWYDMQGRKLQGQPKQKGVYISKGKKVVVK